MTTARRITPVILSGGSGTRLWPLSTADRPKQFHALIGDTTMFAQTLARISDRARFEPPMIVCGQRHVRRVRADFDAMGIADATIVVEPCARNTAPAIALATHAAASDATLLVMPSDHAIADPEAFLAAVGRARSAVESGALATFGIAPDRPHTGYGYIASGKEVAPGVHRVARFVEKPDGARATAMLAEGGHLWNAGIFLMRADAYLSALATHAPAIAAAAETAMRSASREEDVIAPDAGPFGASPALSIDYAVMERADNAVVVPVACGWSDIGNWEALYGIAAGNDGGNVVLGAATAIDATANLLHAAPGMRISALGVEGLIVIATPTEVVVLPRDRAEEVRKLAG